MASVSATTIIGRPRAAEVRLRGHGESATVALLSVVFGEVWLVLEREDPQEAAAQAEAMDRLAELAGQAAAWLRGGDLPEQPGGAL